MPTHTKCACMGMHVCTHTQVNKCNKNSEKHIYKLIKKALYSMPTNNNSPLIYVTFDWIICLLAHRLDLNVLYET